VAAEPFVTTLRIEAPPEIVFDCFCDPNALITWMGDRAELEPSPGGKFEVDIHGYAVRGRYQVLERPRRLVFSWGYESSDDLPPSASTVEVTLVPDGTATQLTLVHRDLPESQAPQHAVGWNHFLPRLAVKAAGGDPGPDPWATEPPPGA
jgi:uncharacterized protein YndB with AHSA1/START domain